MKHAYQTGAREALAQYGLEKEANARLVGTLIGAGVMGLAAQKRDKGKATLLGGLTGYLAGPLAAAAVKSTGRGLLYAGRKAVAPLRAGARMVRNMIP